MASQPLELDVDNEFKRWEWRAERVGWLAWILVVCAGMFGLLGDGPMSDAQVASAQASLRVNYQRYVHRHAPERLDFTVRPKSAEASTVALTLPYDFIDKVNVSRIEPVPVRSVADGSDIRFEFAHLPGTGDVKVAFHLEYDAVGKVYGAARTPDHEAIEFVQVVYP
jgi:hypothetical protein